MADNAALVCSCDKPTERPASGADIVSMLTPMLDQNRDGSVMDDILKNVGRMMGR
jgi:hypothetical protein